ncbi:HAD hydrolase family protein [Salinibius halmophilus]|uniref:HAD hydrolase family protein n=1 Tax=Salinibius halmophilus TaxID=1853216 RepID=UPI000E671EEA|nr:HAD hydrolase family protein [Salinibius halmophilus]
MNSTTCFGDNLNDLPMFTIADTAIATANAVEQTKSSACQVITHHKNDAVAEYLATCEPD